ncbi:MAG: phosphoglucosamine mutase [Deltaproteobacteria bacterium]|nr:phosphoglucosamine mutase [Deltaproteobacteria bacterium]
MGKLFGTDGIRGVANQYPMTPEMALKIGRATAAFFKKDASRSEIVVGKDTRISGDMLEYALVSGICSMGVDAYRTGIMPTPGVSVLTSLIGADAGIVISASHNPFYDNGIKIFNSNGYKLADKIEAEIEDLILGNKSEAPAKPVQEIGRTFKINNAENRYATFLIDAIQAKDTFKGIKIILDCSNGATYRVAPAVFKKLGADVETLFADPDGKNINENCGSQHPEVLMEAVVNRKAQIGLAFDGDGDRLTAVDEKGKLVSGDQLLAVCAKHLKQRELLKNNLVVSTVMSNLGLGLALKDMGITHKMTDVGDRYVMEAMVASGAVLGGEDSGHMIFLDQHTTGDGILAALRLIEVMHAESKPLSELCKIMAVFPQTLRNVEVGHKPDLETVPEIQDAIKSVEKNLGEQGRVLVRYSGTQPICRIMVEGPTKEETDRYCRQLTDIIKNRLGK